MLKKFLKFFVALPLAINSVLGLDSTQLSYREMSLENRYNNSFVNDVFKKNILLNLAYLNGSITQGSNINWDEVLKPFTYQFILAPGKSFAFHDYIQNKYKNSLIKTTNAHFGPSEGFKTDGYLYGDGVCHLASLINWAARDANLETESPTNHNFANIPDIPRQYGVSIYSDPYNKASSAVQNLYITNNRNKAVAFKFEYLNSKVKVSIIELN